MDQERQSKNRGRLATHIAEAIDQRQFDDVRSLSSWAVVARLPFGVQHSYRTADATYVLEAIGVARVGLVGLGYQSDSLRQSRDRLLELANQIAEFWKADARQASIGGCQPE